MVINIKKYLHEFVRVFFLSFFSFSFYRLALTMRIRTGGESNFNTPKQLPTYRKINPRNLNKSFFKLLIHFFLYIYKPKRYERFN